MRHTVGLTDPLRDEDIPPEERVADGLPQSLAACVRAYGLTHYKVKLSGDAPRDLDRLQGIAAVLRQHGPPDFAFTLDGNEQFHDAGAFRAFWESVVARPELADLLPRLLFVEQPLHRDVALSAATGDGLLLLEGAPADHHRRVGRHRGEPPPGPGAGLRRDELQVLQGRLPGPGQRRACWSTGAGSIRTSRPSSAGRTWPTWGRWPSCRTSPSPPRWA